MKNLNIKNLTLSKRLSDGRNNHGHITAYHRGGGFSKRYRLVDFSRIFRNVTGRILRFEKDALRSADVALTIYNNGFIGYTLATDKTFPGFFVKVANNVSLNEGNSLQIKNIPLGFRVHSLELYPKIKDSRFGVFGYAKVARSAGNSAQLLKRDRSYTLIKLRSGELRWFHSDCFATIGVLKGKEHKFEKMYKAGQNRNKGIRPTVRGTAKNPVDHPHGGGQGKTSGGRCSVTPWAKLTKGKRTRKNRSTEKFIYKFRYKNL